MRHIGAGSIVCFILPFSLNIMTCLPAAHFNRKLPVQWSTEQRQLNTSAYQQLRGNIQRMIRRIAPMAFDSSARLTQPGN